jgi:hypothetical protein
MRIRGVVNEAGGGEVRIIVDRDTEEYPPVGCVVVIEDAWSLLYQTQIPCKGGVCIKDLLQS